MVVGSSLLIKVNRMSTKQIRHNSIVSVVDDGDNTYSFYGRVIKTLADNYFLWLCSGLHFHITKGDKLKLESYKGYYNTKGRLIPMTSLRRLKIQASRYHGHFAYNTPLDYKQIKRN